MNTHRLLFAPCLCAAALLAGCGDDEGPVPPDGVACNDAIDAGDSGSTLTAALDQAQSGDCVIAQTHTFQGSFVVKAGVMLVAAEGASPTIEGAADSTAIALAGDPGSLVQGFSIQGGAIGVLVEGSQGALRDLQISAATKSAVAAFRDKALGGPDTLPADSLSLQAVTMSGSATGLWASDVRLALDGGSIHDNVGDTLASGYGLVAVEGTQLVANGTVIQNNSLGVVIDGSLGTNAHLTGLQVLSNVERGVWAQKLAGTAAAPALTIDGNTLIDQNSFVGVGALQSKGIIIIGGKISGTKKLPVVTSLGTVEDIGDGVGLFDATGDAKLDGVSIENNERSQGVIDQGAAGIIIIGGKVEALGDQLKLVVQNTTEMVQAPSDYLSTGVTLAVSQDEVAIQQVVQ
jgi:hypothetical protein